MKLYSHPVSPFARKARIIAHELGIKLEMIDIAAPRKDENFRRINPLKQDSGPGAGRRLGRCSIPR